MVCPCCVKTRCVLQQSGEVADFPGSLVSFEGNGGEFRTLTFDSVSGYWLGAFEGELFEGVTQSVTVSFGEVRPSRVRVRVAALDSGANPERFNYAFAGSSSVVFTVESGDDFVNDGATVSRLASGAARFRLDVEGDISEVFVEGEMIDGGSNGIVVELCLQYA